MFAHPQSNTVEAFTPPALPGFFARPASIPDRDPLPRSLFGLLGILAAVRFRLKSPSDPPGSFFVSMCCSMPSVTPGRGIDHLSWRDRSCCLLQLRKLRPSQLRVFRGYLPDSASIASPRNLSSTPCFRFGLLTRLCPVGFTPTRQRTISRSPTNHPACAQLRKFRDILLMGAAFPSFAKEGRPPPLHNTHISWSFYAAN
jgi:hypothetical protein